MFAVLQAQDRLEPWKAPSNSGGRTEVIGCILSVPGASNNTHGVAADLAAVAMGGGSCGNRRLEASCPERSRPAVSRGGISAMGAPTETSSEAVIDFTSSSAHWSKGGVVEGQGVQCVPNSGFRRPPARSNPGQAFGGRVQRGAAKPCAASHKRMPPEPRGQDRGSARRGPRPAGPGLEPPLRGSAICLSRLPGRTIPHSNVRLPVSVFNLCSPMIPGAGPSPEQLFEIPDDHRGESSIRSRSWRWDSRTGRTDL